MMLNPKSELFEQLDPKSREIMVKTIDFFEKKGKVALKADYHNCTWYSDFLEFVKENRIFATLLTPSQYSNDPNTRWDTYRNSIFNEIISFYGLAYWYTWQVTVLGLGPIWMSQNETLKKRTAKLLFDGGIFAFGLSEKSHGADIYSSNMSLIPIGDSKYIAEGGKYYIGNANEAALVSVFGKFSDKDDYVFFVADPKHKNYNLVKNIVEWQSYVAEFELNAYPIDEVDILSAGHSAWDSALNTVNVGKYNLGWASIGICTNAFYEAITHAAERKLYGMRVTDFPHVKQLFVDAWARLIAMRLFTQRACDYMRVASKEDRRYLLYNPIVKMKVTTQGEEVIDLIWDVIAAKGFEKDMVFENAAKDIRALPKLEGTVHVNIALIVKFMENYLFHPKAYDEVPNFTSGVNDGFLFNQGPAKGLGKIQFKDYRQAYNSVSGENVEIFKEQIAIFKELLVTATPTPEQKKDIDFLLGLGEIFTLIVYGELIIEKVHHHNLSNDIILQIFDILVRDFSEYALKLYQKVSCSEKQMEICLKMIRKPFLDRGRFKKIWKEHVLNLKACYEMNP
jgi:acyl-CoA dehydrogenase